MNEFDGFQRAGVVADFGEFAEEVARGCNAPAADGLGVAAGDFSENFGGVGECFLGIALGEVGFEGGLDLGQGVAFEEEEVGGVVRVGREWLGGRLRRIRVA